MGPKFSVILPVHNGFPYLPETLRSVLGQTLGRFELIVIDDGSTDETPRFLESVQDPRVRYHRIERAGIAGALNHGIGLASTNFVARIDSDDIAAPNRFEVQFAAMSSQPDLVLLGCDCDIVDGNGVLTGDRLFPVSDAALRWAMIFRCPFLHPGVFFRKDAFESCGRYNEEYDCAQDYELWTRISQVGKIASIPEKLMRYRVHENSVTSTKWTLQKQLSIRISAEYGRAMAPSLPPELYPRLMEFLHYSDPISSVEAIRLGTQFQTLAGYFLDRHDCSELGAMIEDDRQRARWKCVDLAKTNRRHPLEFVGFIRAASAFDPEGGSPRAFARRLTRKLRVRSV